MLKPLTVWITQTGKFLKRWEYHSNLPVSWEMCIQDKKVVRTEHGRADWFTIGKGIQQDHILVPCLFHFYAECIMGNARMDESKLESRLPWEISATLDMWWYYYNVRKQRELKSLLMNVKAGLKLSGQKTKIMASGPIIANRRGKSGSNDKFCFLVLPNH